MFNAHLLPDPQNLEAIARETGLIQRSSHKFSAAGFLLGLLQSVTKGDTSLNHIVMHLSAFVRESMTRQAIHQRFGPASSAFLLGVINTVLTSRFPTLRRDLQGGLFRRILIEDSVVVSMAKSNAENFPNNGNGRFETAGCKCLLLVDLLCGKPLDLQLHAARQADQSLAFESVDPCRKGDLIIRDMGFFSIDALREIERRNAFYISRLPASVSLRSTDETALGKLLKNTKGNRIDRAALLGREGLSCRLVAFRLSKARAAANRRHVRREAKRRGVTPNKETLERAGWRILVTNIDSDQLSARRISNLYCLRWSIEIKFRAFKQSCQLSRGLQHQSGYHHIEAMVLAAMIFQLLTLNLDAMLAARSEYAASISIEKLSDAFSIHLMRITSDNQTWAFEPDPRHLKYDRRKRVTHWQAITQCLA